MSTLDSLRQSSSIAIDSASFLDYAPFQATHATTNPSILLTAIQDPRYQTLVKQSRSFVELSVFFGREILKLIPGHLSIQLDPRLSFDIDGSIREAHEFMNLLQSDRVLIKIAATWEGIQTAKHLEREGIHCNVTVVLGLSQALAAAEAGATCIAPYVGRVTDWHKKHLHASEDRGLLTVSAIHHTLKSYGFPTQIMAASFRNMEQILALAGLDILTIQPMLLRELSTTNTTAPKQLFIPPLSGKPILMNEKTFRWALCSDPCADFLLHDAIRRFTHDTQLLNVKCKL